MRRRGGVSGRREAYADLLEVMAGYQFSIDGVHAFAEELARVRAGERVRVMHGYEIDLMPPYSGPYWLEPDGTVTLITDESASSSAGSGEGSDPHRDERHRGQIRASTNSTMSTVFPDGRSR